MKIVVTGSIGHIGKPLTTSLVQQGHGVTVISSTSDRQPEIENLGATAAIGSLEDEAFLTTTFARADAVYTMVPPNNYFDPSLDLLAYYRRLGTNYANALQQAEVKRVVNLSSIGAHLAEGNGILVGAHDVEQLLNQLPPAVSLTHLRPTSFYYNLYAYVDLIKQQGIIATNYGDRNVIPWVSPLDIADAAAEELVSNATGRKIRYVCSDELTGEQTARILGAAIGKPNLPWVVVPDEQVLQGLTSVGMNPKIAAGLVELYAGLQSGHLSEDYFRNRPAILGKVKLSHFAQEFAGAFHQNS
ncbi:NAD(P)H-binding protein [Rufibacter sediminis]|uniref:NAD(P)H-binding protein n=1 Tax=Rufibacter sediminis TaxID=2762756 RepID=A0ABR6VWS4_9BACT|nr:NAD(P)H-binding protein [Rufibacter sediminis]MBC3541640.1 NAD(P)H-binding protein [Rufibacter sediminis]